MTKYLLKITPTAFLLIPLLASAQGINTIIGKLTGLFNNTLIPLIFILATLIFLWGMVLYVAKGHDPAEQKKAKSLMLWGIIGLFVMIAVWGLVNVIATTTGIGTNNTIPGGVQ